MIELAAAAQAVSVVGSAVDVIDKVFNQYWKFKTGQAAPEKLQEHVHCATIRADTEGTTLVYTFYDKERQRVSREELAYRLSKDDLDYIQALETSMNGYFRIWRDVYPSLATEVDPIRKSQLEQRLDVVQVAIGADLRKILDFVEHKCGFELDDHYKAIRELAGQ